MPRLSVRDSLERELAGMSEQVRGSSLAVLALAMAEAIDEKPTAIMAAELAAIIRTLNDLSPPVQVADELDQMRKRVGPRRTTA